MSWRGVRQVSGDGRRREETKALVSTDEGWVSGEDGGKEGVGDRNQIEECWFKRLKHFLFIFRIIYF